MAETVGSFGDLFDLTNPVHKIYRKKDTATRPPLTFMADEWLSGTIVDADRHHQPSARRFPA